MKDPYSGNLDRIQIVKGWLDADGKTKEKVYDVVWSGDRKTGPDGKLPPVGNTVDVEKATWENTIGAPELITRLDRSRFRREAARLLLCDASSRFRRRAGRPTRRSGSASRCPPDVPMTTQERAYTSPIWYTP